jgi:hypothetical protein
MRWLLPALAAASSLSLLLLGGLKAMPARTPAAAGAAASCALLLL